MKQEEGKEKDNMERNHTLVLCRKGKNGSVAGAQNLRKSVLHE